MRNTSTELYHSIFIGTNGLLGVFGEFYDMPYAIVASLLNFSAYIGYQIYEMRNQRQNRSSSEQIPLLIPDSISYQSINLADLLELELSTPIEINDLETGQRESSTSVNSCSKTPNKFPYSIKTIFTMPLNDKENDSSLIFRH